MPPVVSAAAATDDEIRSGPEAAAEVPAPRFRFRNLGPVKEAELELGDLTLLVGGNNTGKTYLAYALYGFLKVWRTRPRIEELLGPAGGSGGSEPKSPALLDALSRAAARGKARWPVTPEELQRRRVAALAAFAERFARFDLPSVLGGSTEDFPGAFCEWLPGDLPLSALRSYSFSSQRLGSWSFRFDGKELDIECSGWLDPPISVSLLSQAWARYLLPELRIEPFALSEERFGISLFPRKSDFTENRSSNALDEYEVSRVGETDFAYALPGRGAIGCPLPFVDNFAFSRSLPDRGRERSALWPSRAHNEVRDLVGADFRVDEGGAIRVRSKARGDRRYDIPLHLASSSARGLSDLYFFLKHAAGEEQLLLVDEPESHLDVWNQMRLAGVLSRLVRAGIRILLTTHSDYLLKECNNLIMHHQAGENYPESPDLDYSPEDALDPGRVRVYTVERGGLSACAVDEFGMAVPFFDAAIRKINRASHALRTRVQERKRRT